MAKSDVTLTTSHCAVIDNALQLKRESLVRAQRKEISGSEMFSVIGRQIMEIDQIRTLIFSLGGS